MNLPLNIFSTTVTVLTGLVIYAYYASCDPRTIGEISKDDEVPTYMYQIKAVLLEESQGAQLRLLSKKYRCPALTSFHKSKVIQVAQRQKLVTCGTRVLLKHSPTYTVFLIR